MKDFFPIIELKGKPYTMGKTHGRILAKEIQANLELYFMMLRGLTGLEPQQCLTHAARILDVMQKDAPHLLEEMEGIADGAQVSLNEILFLNARSELMSMGRAPDDMPGECTAIGLTGERTISGKPILAQNWDWHERVLQTTAIFRIEPAQGPKAVFLAEAGQVAKIGVNENGLGVLLNILIIEGMEYGLPVHVLLRLVLGAKDTAEAVALVENAHRAGASHFLIGDKSGNIKGLELMPQAIKEIVPAGGALVHTNHYCDADLAKKDVGRLLMTDSFARLDRAAALISTRQQWDDQSLAEIFTNHDDVPRSICRHARAEDEEYLRIDTVASCIIDPTESKIQVSYGQPCGAPYREVALL
jgi:isopenicillin-N N-acyltransferase-like protein